MNTPLSRFYTEDHTDQPLIVGENRTASSSTLDLSTEHVYRKEVPGVVQEELGRKIVQLYQSIEPVTVSVRVDGEMRRYRFEIGYLEQGAGDDVELRTSSYSSSLTTNPGNVTEVAQWATARPERSFAYVASPGNGLTSPLAKDERRFFRKHGSLVFDEGDGIYRPLPFVRALHLALGEQGIHPTRLGSDSAGTIVATAYGSLKEVNGHIQSSHQNVRTNIADRPWPQMINGMLYREGQKNGPFYAKSTPDPLSVPKWDAFVRERIPTEFVAKDFDTGKSVPMLVSNLIGLGRGPAAGNPLLTDNIAFLRNNGDANVLFTNGREDPLVDPSTIDEEMMNICQRLARYTTGRVMSAVIDGVSHGPHTFYPQYIQTLSATTLDRV